MPKKSSAAVELDPTVQRVKDSYEASLTHFMANISPMLQRYNQLLQAALPQNPKADFFNTATKEAEKPATTAEKAVHEDPHDINAVAEDSPVKQPTSPLLRRPKLDPATMAELEQSAVELLRQSSAVQINPKGSSSPTLGSEAVKTPLTAQSVTAKKKKDDKENKAPTTQQLESLALPPLLLVQLKIIKQEARELGKTLDQIHDWIALNIPTMKEEDNLGVAVMASVIGELAQSIAKVRGVYDMESGYVSDRAELDVKYLKTTDAESTLQAIEVCDSDAWDTLEKGWRALMRVALLVHATLAKNMKLLKDPRGGPKANLHL